MTTGPNGQPCVSFYLVTNQPALTATAPRATYQLLHQYPLCPAAIAPPRVPPPAVPALNPAVLAEAFWHTIRLPVPRPAVPPGYAVTGMLAYLVTHGTVAPRRWTDATPLGPLSVTAHGRYFVTWGDGGTSGPFSAEGLPYPVGAITHTYDTAGSVVVTVTEGWTATWTLGAAGGVLQQLQTVARIAAFPIRQVQAVITN